MLDTRNQKQKLRGVQGRLEENVTDFIVDVDYRPMTYQNLELKRMLRQNPTRSKHTLQDLSWAGKQETYSSFLVSGLPVVTQTGPFVST